MRRQWTIVSSAYPAVLSSDHSLEACAYIPPTSAPQSTILYWSWFNLQALGCGFRSTSSWLEKNGTVDSTPQWLNNNHSPIRRPHQSFQFGEPIPVCSIKFCFKNVIWLVLLNFPPSKRGLWARALKKSAFVSQSVLIFSWSSSSLFSAFTFRWFIDWKSIMH